MFLQYKCETRTARTVCLKAFNTAFNTTIVKSIGVKGTAKGKAKKQPERRDGSPFKLYLPGYIRIHDRWGPREYSKLLQYHAKDRECSTRVEWFAAGLTPDPGISTS